MRLYLGPQGYFQGAVIRMTLSGFSVDFEGGDRPLVSEGQALELAISSTRLNSSLRLPARVFEVRDDELRRSVDFVLDGEAQMALRALVDGRNECRVAPAREILVMLMQDRDDVYAEGQLDDLSLTGLSVRMRTQQMRPLDLREQTRISFFIPGEMRPIQLFGHVRHRRDESEGRRLGFQFIAGIGDFSHADYGRYARYVEDLKDEVLRHLRRLRLDDVA